MWLVKWKWLVKLKQHLKKIGGNVEATGNAKAADFEAAGGIKLTTHKHTSASPGNPTGPALP